jgi:hypothetical protein
MSVGARTTSTGGSSSPSTGAPTKVAPVKVVARDFVIELNSCKLSARILTCQFTITNDAPEDRVFRLLLSSRIFDDLGNDYTASECQVGKETSGFGGVDSLLVPRIVTKAVLRFENINQEATKITLLRLTLASGSPFMVDFNVDFRNPPLTK